MAEIVLFHSMLGLRPVEQLAAERLRQAGHRVTAPDLYGGCIASTMDEGYALMADVGWERITQRARDAMRAVPADAALVGLSMGCGVIGSLLPERPGAGAVVLLHALAGLPANARPGLPLQVHVGGADGFAPPADVAALVASAAQAGVDAEVFSYPGLGHFYTDAAMPEHDAQAAALTWQRVQTLLQR